MVIYDQPLTYQPWLILRLTFHVFNHSGHLRVERFSSGKKRTDDQKGRLGSVRCCLSLCGAHNRICARFLLIFASSVCPITKFKKILVNTDHPPTFPFEGLPIFWPCVLFGETLAPTRKQLLRSFCLLSSSESATCLNAERALYYEGNHRHPRGDIVHASGQFK